MAKFFFIGDHLINSDSLKSIEIACQLDPESIEGEYTFQLKAHLEHKIVFGDREDCYDYVQRQLEDIHDYLTEAQA